MFKPRFTQSKVRYLWTLLFLIGLSLSACAPAAAPPQPLAESAPAEAEVSAELVVAGEIGSEAVAADSGRTITNLGSGNTPNVYRRLIIKNAELELTVEDTDTAINRTLGIITEYGGYVVSNRAWFDGELKYATLTTGVPAENFEAMLQRLKDLGTKVTNETVSGQDVTDEFVDLESRLRNLNTTADRIRTFMDQAKDVNESLAVSARLAELEGEIEQVKGRMNYLKDRAAFSTITLQIIPQAPEPVVSEPEPWNAWQSVIRTSKITSQLAHSLYRITVEVTVFLAIVILPFMLPVVLLLWAGFKVLRRLGLSKAKAG
jgi:hypothetical protein